MYDQIKDTSLSTVSQVLAFFYSLPVVGGSYGVAIMLLTATVMILLMPLTIKATRSTIKMTQLQPQLRALQKEHKDDKQLLNQEMMKLYSEHGVNPVGGCLPMLAQLPVFLILFNVLRGLTRRVSDRAYFSVANRAHEITGGSVTDGRTFDPEHLDQDSLLYQDLAGATSMRFGPFDLARDAWDIVQTDFLGALPYVVLILFVVGSSYYQQRQISARRGSVPDNPTPQQQTQQQLLRVLPLMSGVWSFLFPAGLVLYWATSNLFRIGQQAYITRALYRGDDPGAEMSVEDDVDADDDAAAKPARKATSAGAQSNGADAAEAKEAGARSEGLSKAERRARNRERFRDRGDDTAGETANKTANDAVGGRSKNNEANGATADRADRDEAWAKRRAQRTKTQQKNKTAEGSSRTTPKGTKPSGSKKKRKR